jgi:DNA helicase II / ATP-dependent DNA helicase PcrA
MSCESPGLHSLISANDVSSQDTNVTQYELMKALAVDRCVSVVGDPDQSSMETFIRVIPSSTNVIRIKSQFTGGALQKSKIWQRCVVVCFRRLNIDIHCALTVALDFSGTEEIFLEQNYRSTAAILKASLAIVAQGKLYAMNVYRRSSSLLDKSRIQKSLHTNHPSGATPVLRAFPTEHAEATFIAVECKRLVAEMGGILRWGDFVVLRELPPHSLYIVTHFTSVLVRFNALSRAIESALQKEGIPSRVLGGHKFFERLEVCLMSFGRLFALTVFQIKSLLAYLQLADNSSFNPALIRAVNIPSRGIGEKVGAAHYNMISS